VKPREVVRSRANPAYKRLLSAKERAREGRGHLLLEGPKLVGEAVAAGLALELLAVSERASDGPLARMLNALGSEPRVFSETLLASLSEVETSQGVLAIAKAPRFSEAAVLGGVPLLLVACGIQNPGNLGGLLRTAEAAGATGALLTKGSADPFSWKSLRGSMGSALRLPHHGGLSVEEILTELRERRVRLVAADRHAPLRYDAADLRAPLAIAVGSEGSGLPDALVAAAEVRVAIPLRAPVESLNVGVAAGVLFFEAARQREAGS
jgi:TrmH family RNA methyltransferase